MKRIAISITLLLSFLVMIGHTVIPHHHHEITTIDPSDHQPNHRNHIHEYSDKHLHPLHQHKHHHHADRHDDHAGDDSKDHKEIPKQTHRHSFPAHFHHIGTDDFQFNRILNYEVSLSSHDYDDFYYAGELQNTIFVPAKFQRIYYHKQPVLIHPLFITGANCLRAPPAIS